MDSRHRKVAENGVKREGCDDDVDLIEIVYRRTHRHMHVCCVPVSILYLIDQILLRTEVRGILRSPLSHK
jgi:hypothetical protein